jgi:hypothetical protein
MGCLFGFVRKSRPTVSLYHRPPPVSCGSGAVYAETPYLTRPPFY